MSNIHQENIIEKFVKQTYFQKFSLFFVTISLVIIMLDLLLGFPHKALIFNESGNYIYPFARGFHFFALMIRLLLGVFAMFLIFSNMFGSQLNSIVNRLKKNKLALIGFGILITFIVMAVFADYIADYEKVVIKQNLANTFAKPGTSALLGTDDLGRDIFARIIHGTRISLTIGFISVSLSILIGGLLGAISGYVGGRFDNITMRVMDIFLAIPSILLSIAIVSALGTSFPNLVMALSISTIPVYARIVRASVLSIRGQEFIEAAHAIGAHEFYIIIKHVIPNVLSPIIVQGTLGIASAILSIAGLSFIGLGVEPPTPEWGSMLAGGRTLIRKAPWITTYPGIAIMMSILSLNLLGDGLRDALDPRLK